MKPLNIEQWPIGKIKPFKANPRTHSQSQVDVLKSSIAEFGFVNPCIVDAKGTLIVGHGRFLAAEQAGLKTIPVIRVEHLTPKQVAALRLADNRIYDLGGWDDDLLRQNIEDLKLGDGFNFDALGWSAEQLDELLAFGNPGLVDPEVTPDPVKDPIVRAGDVWQLGNHRIICGSSTIKADVDRLLNGAKPNLMVTDPPYGVSYDPGWRNQPGKLNLKSTTAFKGRHAASGKVVNDDRSDWTAAWTLFVGNVAYVWHGERQSPEIVAHFRVCKFEPRNLIVWAKDGLVISRGHYHPQHETCWYLVRDGATANWHGDRKQSTLWSISRNARNETGHGTQKPIECMKRPIENNSRKGEHIYEPFSGSGTTIIACEMTGRKCLAIEIDPAYTQVAIERWQTFAGKKATLNGRSFDEIAKERSDEKKARPKLARV